MAQSFKGWPQGLGYISVIRYNDPFDCPTGGKWMSRVCSGHVKLPSHSPLVLLIENSLRDLLISGIPH